MHRADGQRMLRRCGVCSRRLVRIRIQHGDKQLGHRCIGGGVVDQGMRAWLEGGEPTDELKGRLLGTRSDTLEDLARHVRARALDEIHRNAHA